MLVNKNLDLKSITVWLFFIIILSACAKKKEVYLFSYFTDNGQDGLHLAYSYNALEWHTLNGGDSFLTPTIGKDRLMRDPSIARGKDGTFHLVWTTGWWDKGIGYASSKDLINWSEQKNIPVMEHLQSTKNTWAPEIFYDKNNDLFYIIWASTVPELFPEIKTSANEKGLNHRQYYTTTRDFNSFSPTKLFYDPGFSVIDAAILQRESNYMMVIKNEMSIPEEKNLRISFTHSLDQGFPVTLSENISGNAWAEGPTALMVNDYIYIYFDKYREHQYGAIRSKDAQTWEDISASIQLPKGIRHGTAFCVSENVLNKLLSKKTYQ
ncbi:glycoside hydrolase family 43 protein [Saccharicrinis fermentans]|uniref:Beta-xylosidase n=1 Tax=Saccharicrinis fermentans DSM 9555 = JCM 21142 TaxID=869213 RepID=W7Y3G7_9BACT|nr:glycoside hydrolase family 43 protein [Saccharicrinis fermentans]GAF02103.1 beta-xylosidase [Saccharicrinis fermentans DSM 9555 = JCM 21142]